MGNNKNIPFIAGFSSITPSAISVGATNHPKDYEYDKSIGPSMADYSSRGPGLMGAIKPDIVAPSGLALAAAGTGVGGYSKITGTSFSAPLVAGAIALLKEKCGANCSPFSLKAILMNNANRHIKYHEDALEADQAPISWTGAGELQLLGCLSATMWAYSVEDIQPSIALGVINAADTTTIRRTIRIMNLSPNKHQLSFSAEFRNKTQEESGALTIEFPSEQELAGNGENCSSFVDVTVEFTVNATKVPANHMTSTGPNRDDPTVTIDVNEFGGHLLILSETTTSSVSLPFMAFLRAASDVTIENSQLNYDGRPGEVEVGLTNHGAGVAQINAYQVLFFGSDEKEASFGDSNEKVDLRMVGYRVFRPTSGADDCTYMFEWAFQTWEQQERLKTTVFELQIDVDADRQVDYFVFNAGQGSKHTSSPTDILVKNARTGSVSCGRGHVQHHTYSTVTTLQICSDQLGITNPGFMLVQTRASSVNFRGEIEASSGSPYAIRLTYPEAELSAPSYNLAAGDSLETISVEGSNDRSNGYAPLGLMLVTNAYRSPNSTGAAAPGTETLLVVSELVGKDEMFKIYDENTVDKLDIPPPLDLQGPDCSWEMEKECAPEGRTVNSATKSVVSQESDHSEAGNGNDYTLFLQYDDNVEAPACPAETMFQEFNSMNAPSAPPSLRPSSLPATVQTSKGN